MTVSNHQRKKKFYLLRNHRARDRTIMNGREIVTGIETRDILDPKRKPKRTSRGQEAGKGTETEIGGSVNAADHRNLTRRRIKIKIETGTVIEEMTEKGRGKEKESEIGEENVIELGIKMISTVF